jgi:hypothetical protein
VRTLQESDHLDVVVTNGYDADAAGEVLRTPNMQAVVDDPLGELVKQNWLLPGSWLCRTETVGAWLFEGMPPFMECTFLAILFSTRCRVVFLDEPTITWRADTPESASKSPAYVLSEPAGLHRLLELDLPPDMRRAYRRKLSRALHSVSDWHRSRGQMGEAWKQHLASLRWPGGWRHLPYTRRLLSLPGKG